jgi:RNA polymerase sigma factor (sigma-70 family)
MRAAVAFPVDQELLSAFRRGQREALERVYRAHVRGIEGYLRALVRRAGSSDLAQPSAIADLLQEVFTRAFSDRARQAYDGVRDYGAYLGTIARNCLIDQLRVRGREVLTDGSDHPFEASADADQDYDRDPQVTAVLTAYLAGLEPALRAVYDQRFARGCSQEEACLTLGLSRRSLRTAEEHLRRGLRKALVRAGISLQELRPSGRQPPALVAVVPAASSGGPK